MARQDAQPDVIGTVNCANKGAQVYFLRDADGSPIIQLEDELGGAEVRPTLPQLAAIVTHVTRLYRICVMGGAAALAGTPGVGAETGTPSAPGTDGQAEGKL